ncbi:MAG: hypothetical protein HUK20_12555, partial [Fibrobacter sp.]|nr:hypothetical protein [Fibrobacter sp.]
IKAYELEMKERQRIDRASSKAYTEELIKKMSAELADKDATIEAKDAALANKDCLIANLMRQIASLKAMPGTAKA